MLSENIEVLEKGFVLAIGSKTLPKYYDICEKGELLEIEMESYFDETTGTFKTEVFRELVEDPSIYKEVWESLQKGVNCIDKEAWRKIVENFHTTAETDLIEETEWHGFFVMWHSIGDLQEIKIKGKKYKKVPCDLPIDKEFPLPNDMHNKDVYFKPLI